MDIYPDDDLVEICTKIVQEGRSIAQWCEIESDDMFQTGRYHGGFDSIEQAFCFSAYTDDGEFWFQFTLQQALSISAGEMIRISARLAEN